MSPDISAGWEVRGDTREEIFRNAAWSLTARLVDAETIVPGGLRDRIQLEAKDEQALLTTWLNRLLGLYQKERMVFCQFSFRTLTNTHLDAAVDGELLDPLRHNAKTPPPKTTLQISSRHSNNSYVIESIRL